jgi:hypothetical protein
VNSEKIDPTAYFENRLKMRENMKQKGVSPHPHKWPVNMSIPDFIKKYEGIADGTQIKDDEVTLAGTSCLPERYFCAYVLLHIPEHALDLCVVCS